MKIDDREVKIATNGSYELHNPPRITVPNPPVERAVQRFYINRQARGNRYGYTIANHIRSQKTYNAAGGTNHGCVSKRSA